MTRSSPHRGLLDVALASALTLAMPFLVASCSKKEPPAPPPAPPPETAAPAATDAAPLTLDLPDLDAGADEADSGKKAAGKPVNSVEAAIKTCCAVLTREAKALGTSAEANVLKGQADQCNSFAKSVGQNPNAPELAAARALFNGKFPGCNF